MDDRRDAEVKRLLDREAILDCLHRYTRGCDRLDRDLVLSAYHGDARDRRGSPQEMADAFWSSQDTRVTCQHYLTNVVIDLRGDTAHVESYFLSINRQTGEEHVRVVGGRYVDRFERRDGEWKIAVRIPIPEWNMVGTGSPLTRQLSRRDAGDLSYERPLRPPAASGD